MKEEPSFLTTPMHELISRRIVKPAIRNVGFGVSVPEIVRWAYVQGVYDTVQVMSPETRPGDE